MTTSRLKKVLKKRSRNRFQAQFLLWIAALLAALYLFTFREIPVLMYHFVGTASEARENSLVVSAETFDKQLSWLRKWGYRIYSLDEYYVLKTGKQFFFQKGVVLTFDDGNQGFLNQALSILENYKAPAANFLVANSLLKKENGSMSVEEVRELSKNPLITLGAHTTHHLELIDLSDAVLREEIVDCRQNLEKMLGKSVLYFAYPGGYFDERALRTVQETGYRLAFSTSWKRLKKRAESLHTLIRIKVAERDSMPIRFWYKVSGFYSLLKRFQHAF